MPSNIQANQTPTYAIDYDMPARGKQEGLGEPSPEPTPEKKWGLRPLVDRVTHFIQNIRRKIWRRRNTHFFTCATTQFYLRHQIWRLVHTKKGEDNGGVDCSHYHKTFSGLDMIVTAEKLKNTDIFQSKKALIGRLRDWAHGHSRNNLVIVDSIDQARVGGKKMTVAEVHYVAKVGFDDTDAQSCIFVGTGPGSWRWQVEFIDQRGNIVDHFYEITNIMTKGFYVRDERSVEGL